MKGKRKGKGQGDPGAAMAYMRRLHGSDPPVMFFSALGFLTSLFTIGAAWNAEGAASAGFLAIVHLILVLPFLLLLKQDEEDDEPMTLGDLLIMGLGLIPAALLSFTCSLAAILPALGVLFDGPASSWVSAGGWAFLCGLMALGWATAEEGAKAALQNAFVLGLIAMVILGGLVTLGDLLIMGLGGWVGVHSYYADLHMPLVISLWAILSGGITTKMNMDLYTWRTGRD